MEIKLIKKNKGITREISKTYQVTNFLTEKLSENISVAISEAVNHSEITKNIKSDRVYYILEGKLIVKKDGKEFIAKSGDVIFIPKNTEYHFSGTFKTILINSPSFNSRDEQIKKLCQQKK